MGILRGEVRYALRQFWTARVFTVTAVSSVSLAVCAFFAAAIPARRAATISPIRALRSY